MEREAVKVLSGDEYDHLFPRALMTTILEKKGATVADTIGLIPRIVNETRWQTLKIAKVLKGKTTEETCRNIWEFVYKHIAYKKDEAGKEQVRSPARTWADRFLGLDCDCMTTFISSVLSNLGIRHRLRITKYADEYGTTNLNFSHIYPVVILPGGKQITIDCVVHSFNREVPYREKHDTKMDLEYLNGVYPDGMKTTEAKQLAEQLDDLEGLGELGKLFKKKSSGGGGGSHSKPKTKLKDVFKKGGVKKAVQNVKQNVKQKVQNVKQTVRQDVKKVQQAAKNVNIKKVLNVVNKANPATVALRLGVLAGMKLNFLKIGSRLKYAYMSDAEAQKRGVDMGKLASLRKVKDKLESIFYGAGGNQSALKEAILTGKGNSNHDVVAGLGYAEQNLIGMDENTPLPKLLGQSYYEEVNGLGELGVVAAASITAASGALAAIAGLLKQIGSIFPKKDKASKDFEDDNNGGDNGGDANADTTDTGADASGSAAADQGASDNSGADQQSNASPDSFSDNASSGNSAGDGGGSGDGTSAGDSSGSSGSSSDTNSSGTDNGSGQDGSDQGSNLPATTDNNNPPDNPGAGGRGMSPAAKTTAPGFWQNNKKWIISSGIGLVIICIGGFIAMRKPSAPNPPPPKAPALQGVPKSRRRKNTGKKNKASSKPKIKSTKKKKVVAHF